MLKVLQSPLNWPGSATKEELLLDILSSLSSSVSDEHDGDVCLMGVVTPVLCASPKVLGEVLSVGWFGFGVNPSVMRLAGGLSVLHWVDQAAALAVSVLVGVISWSL